MSNQIKTVEAPEGFEVSGFFATSFEKVIGIGVPEIDFHFKPKRGEHFCKWSCKEVIVFKDS